MMLVELTVDMRPKRAGEDMLLPDGVAETLVASGEARNPRDRFGAPLDPKQVAPQHVPRHLRKYLTKG